MNQRKNHPLLKIINGTLVDLPVPSNISHLWNLGSLLGLFMVIQILTGIFLTMQYSSNILTAFNCLDHIMRDITFGWLLRMLHANGASMFFVALYIHIGRNLFYKTHTANMSWTTGIALFFLSMLTAFLGYVLPWGQMSYWGATVITNLLSAIPAIGVPMVEWVWGSFSVDNPTLARFFALHYLFPFIILIFIVLHLFFIHENKSSNPLGLDNNYDKIFFSPYFIYKDLISILTVLFFFMILNFQTPFLLMDPDNFNPANPMITPAHIQPEWYFLFAYAILRAIPNKLGGVVALLMSILILMITTVKQKKTQYSKTHTTWPLFWPFIMNFFLLTILGASPIETPFTEVSYACTFFYFSWYLLI